MNSRAVFRVMCLLLAAAPAFAQEPTALPTAEVTVRQVDERQFPRITLDFEVKAADGSPIPDAPREAFRVLEDGRPVEVTEFRSPISREIRPTTVVLVLDKSSSMKGDRMPALKRAVAAFLEVQPEGSEVAVVAFGSDVELLCDFTDDVDRIRRRVNTMRPLGQTRFYDAVEGAVALLEEKPGRRAVVAMTDGEDTASESSDMESAIVAARRAGLPVHVVGMGTTEEVAEAELHELAEGTRGRYFSAREADQLGAIYEEIARSLKQSYALTYRTGRPLQDGTLRPIEVMYLPAPATSGRADVFIQGIVAPTPGWSGLFVGLVAALGLAGVVPSLVRRRESA